MKRLLALIAILSVLLAVPQAALAGYKPGGGGSSNLSTATGVLAPNHGGTGVAVDTTSLGLSFTSASSQQVSIPDNAALNPSSAMTIEAWVKAPDTGNALAVLSHQKADATATRFSFMVYAGGNVEFYMDGASGGDVDAAIYTTPPLVPGKWTHLAVTVSTSAPPKLYINGVEAAAYDTQENTLVGGFLTVTDPLTVGFDNYYGSGYSDGSVADIRLYDVVRTQSEIASDYASALSSPYDSHLKAYFKTSEGTGTTLVDAVGAHNGTISNSPAWVASGLRPDGGAIPTFKNTQDGFILSVPPTPLYRSDADALYQPLVPGITDDPYERVMEVQFTDLATPSLVATGTSITKIGTYLSAYVPTAAGPLTLILNVPTNNQNDFSSIKTDDFLSNQYGGKFGGTEIYGANSGQFRWWFGFFDGDPSQTDTPTNGWGFRSSSSSGSNNIEAVCVNGGVATVADTGVQGVSAGLTAPHKYLSVRATDGSKVDFYIDGVLKQTITTNIPPSSSTYSLYSTMTKLSSTATNEQCSQGIAREFAKAP